VTSRPQAFDDEPDVRRTLRQASHVPGKPGRPVTDQNAAALTAANQTAQRLRADTVMHLIFESVRRLLFTDGALLYSLDQFGIMRGKTDADSAVLRSLKHAFGEFEVVFIGIALFWERNVGRLLVSAFDQTNPGFERNQRLEIIGSAKE